ncbi:uncharacterized protein LOC112468781 [Temnothorax curvispinosus]|uniref:Uncharacterized protein LOC112457638 n=1 Tax=Temnothorax curvispinosus TaxID=300111 RepID=A0A6J1RMI1_9HYME|nr:uncharacterized protein LOC112457638 [Temnothorax curvispinosus]XP_024893895.1 uncharacterized protein LOC112468781 [Temnothorax curvispinosus]
MGSSSDELTFQLNDDIFCFNTKKMKIKDVKSIKEDDKYAVKYLINLIENEFINLQDPLQIIYKIVNNEQIVIYEADKEESCQLQSELEQAAEEDGTRGAKKRSEWGKQDTEILLEKYEIYVKLVGPMKKFKNKKVMWEKIAQDIEDTIGRKYTSIQVENRFKTLLKRKKDAIQHNKRSGNDRVDVPYEDQLEKIASLDDSIKQEMLMSINNTRILKNNESSSDQSTSSSSAVKMIPEKKTVHFLKRKIEKETKENKKKSVQETLLEIHQLKEESKEKRHKEKLALIEKLFKKDM